MSAASSHGLPLEFPVAKIELMGHFVPFIGTKGRQFASQKAPERPPAVRVCLATTYHLISHLNSFIKTKARTVLICCHCTGCGDCYDSPKYIRISIIYQAGTLFPFVSSLTEYSSNSTVLSAFHSCDFARGCRLSYVCSGKSPLDLSLPSLGGPWDFVYIFDIEM